MARSFAYKLGRVVKRAALADLDLSAAPSEVLPILQSIAQGQGSREYAKSQGSWWHPLKRIGNALGHNDVRQQLVDAMAGELQQRSYGSGPGASNPAVYAALQKLLTKKLQSKPAKPKTSKPKSPADKKKKD